MSRLIASSIIALAVLASGTALAQAPPAASAPDPCGAGLAEERAATLPAAFVHLTRCMGGPTAGRPADASAALDRVKKRLRDGDFAPVALVVTPSTATLRMPTLIRDPMSAPFELWLPFGTHRYSLGAPGMESVDGEVVVTDRSRQTVTVTLRRTATAAGTTEVDFGDDGPAVDTPVVAADPRPKKHANLIPKRWLGPQDTGAALGPVSDGPRGSAAKARRTPQGPSRRRAPWSLTWGL